MEGGKVAENGDRFGGRLKELRDGKGLTQKQLGDLAGMPVNTIARLERGERKPSWDTVLALANALGVSCEAFTQPPAERDPSGPGRPPKPKDEEEVKPKRPRGRPRKDDR